MSILPRTLVPHAFVGEQTADTVVLSVDRAQVEAMLPPELTPAALDDSAHPVVLAFGRQSRVRPPFLPVRGMAYHEVIVAVPAVRFRYGCDPSEVFTYLPKLWLDHAGATALGVLGGFAKAMATIEVDEGTYRVHERGSDRLLLEASFRPTGDAGTLSSFPALSRSSLPKLISRPILNRSALGPFVTTTMDWHLDEATFQSTDASVSVAEGVLPGLFAGTYAARGIASGEFGAYRIAHRWDLTVPKRLVAPAPVSRRTRSATPFFGGAA